ncbi:hypothetical protein W97_07871 [Coniosporium apollinis CBS 100218]|uniref:FAD-binding FR-type domain-containing protein n=1 Tax=Coniosporium apollinis (strain CBS 100218) TaxID=1168221 RepID=R7Z3G0_CONA1|nr:uncharacterized protein W97_07871 [Coniosporium apollinis CBS 100218]EON68613.1 hypothetical protein W97_07871 [Coniosporium apollinis CBS 100218]
MAFSMALPWSPGEETMHRLLRVPEQDNPTSSMLTPQAAFMLQRAPLLAIGTLDAEQRPWTTIWGGDPGFSRSLGASIIGVRTAVDGRYDPVVETLVGGNGDGEVVKETGRGRMVGGLAIDLTTRKRVKLFGRMVAGALSRVDGEGDGDGKGGHGEIQLVVRIEQSLGNCPKYLNKKEIRPAESSLTPELLADGPTLSPAAIALLAKADLFFVSSSNSDFDMDTNNRGGPPGFVRVVSNGSEAAELVWPEYSGNRLYQTLGNLQITPKAGLVFSDFETGDVLYMTGTTKILVGKEASALLPRSNLAVKLKITEARFVRQGLPFRGTFGEPSPYNPNLRLLVSEGNLRAKASDSPSNTAKLLKQTPITPTISRFRFAMTNPVRYKAGQWVALDFSEELDLGYSHMRDDDPRSLNDDFVRTFTVSSPPAAPDGVPPTSEDGMPPAYDGMPHDEFEITIRKVGPVTEFLFRQSDRSGLEVPLRDFGGDFAIEQPGEDGEVGYVTSGVGITPLLAQIPALDLRRMQLLWTVRMEDLKLVVDTIEKYPRLGPSARVFVTGSRAEDENGWRSIAESLRGAGVRLELRRLLKSDLDIPQVQTWYVCASKALSSVIFRWLEDRRVVYESFDY